MDSRNTTKYDLPKGFNFCKKSMEIDFLYIHEDGEEEEIVVKAELVECHVCYGDGYHTNPAIDGHGISAQDFYDDPEFESEYRMGMYDIRCNCCHGEKQIPQASWQNSKSNLEKYNETIRAHDEFQRHCRAEMRGHGWY